MTNTQAWILLIEQGVIAVVVLLYWLGIRGR